MNRLPEETLLEICDQVASPPFNLSVPPFSTPHLPEGDPHASWNDVKSMALTCKSLCRIASPLLWRDIINPTWAVIQILASQPEKLKNTRLIWLYLDHVPSDGHDIWCSTIKSLLQASGGSLHSLLIKCPKLPGTSDDLFSGLSGMAQTLPNLRHLSLEGGQVQFTTNVMVRSLLLHFKGCELDTLEVRENASLWGTLTHQLAQAIVHFKPVRRLSLQIERPSRNTHSDFASVLQTIASLTNLVELQLKGGIFKIGPEKFLGAIMDTLSSFPHLKRLNIFIRVCIPDINWVVFEKESERERFQRMEEAQRTWTGMLASLPNLEWVRWGETWSWDNAGHNFVGQLGQWRIKSAEDGGADRLCISREREVLQGRSWPSYA